MSFLHLKKKTKCILRKYGYRQGSHAENTENKMNLCYLSDLSSNFRTGCWTFHF